jgi:glycosyltransferase involved in cell wall biosynthesis
MIGRLAARLAKVPVVIHTVHGFAFHEFSSSLTVRVYSLLERIAARWCDCIVFVNEFHRQWALQLNIVAPAKTITIPNGIPASYPKSINRDKLREEFSISPSAKLIGSIGRLAAQKGLEYLIKAMPGIVARFPETYLILVGDGPLRRALEQLAIHLGLAGRIFFTGFRLDADVLCPEFDIVVLPSLREGLSIALLEAMRVGKPIVTTEIGSNLNVVSDQKDALLVQPANIRELENAVIQLLEEPYMGTRLGESARLTFKEHFTEDRMLASYYQIYLNLLAVRRDRLGADSFQNNIRKV